MFPALSGTGSGTATAYLWQHAIMIVSSGHKGVWIDIGNNKPGLILQQRKRGDRWRDYLVDGKQVVSPVDIETLPAGKYRLVN